MSCGRVEQERQGFTLVELLVVIVILGVLTALITAAAAGAFTAAKEVAIKTEIDSLDQAMKSYRAEHGEFPPSDFSDAARVRRHLQKRYPRANFSSYTVPSLTPAQAMVFWLQGFYNNPVDPLTPFNSSDLSEGRDPALMDFDPTRLIDPNTNEPFKPGGTPPVYVPTHGAGKPYLYFESSTYATAVSYGKKPYLADEGISVYEAPDAFQIISAGLDGDYGAGSGATAQPSYPSGKNYAEGDWDNITNFSRRNLEVSRP